MDHVEKEDTVVYRQIYSNGMINGKNDDLLFFLRIQVLEYRHEHETGEHYEALECNKREFISCYLPLEVHF